MDLFKNYKIINDSNYNSSAFLILKSGEKIEFKPYTYYNQKKWDGTIMFLAEIDSKLYRIQGINNIPMIVVTEVILTSKNREAGEILCQDFYPYIIKYANFEIKATKP